MSSPAYRGEMYGVKNYCEPYITEEQAQKSTKYPAKNLDRLQEAYLHFLRLDEMPDLRLQAFRVCNRQKRKKYKVYHCPTLSHKSTRPTRDQKKLETYMLNHIEEKYS